MTHAKPLPTDHLAIPPSAPSSDPAPRARATAFALAAIPALLLLVAGVAMAAWTWRTWPDAIIDFGRELYVPWQLAQGKVLYRDTAYFNGPLSPYLNALWFRILGPSLLTLVIFNLAIVALIAALLYHLLRRFEGPAASTVGVLAFLLLFAFSRYEWIGNSNYICPYSHETTHGIAFCLGLLLLLDRYLRAGGRAWLVLSGLTLGLLFLTKVEICVAAIFASVASILLYAWASRRPASVLPDGAALLAPALVAPAAAIAALSLAMPADEAWLGVLGSWRYAFNSRLSTLLYFKIGSGLLDPLDSARRLAFAAGGIAAFVALAAAFAWACRRSRTAVVTGSIAISMLVVSLLGLGWHLKTIPWLDLARPLPLAMLALIITGLIRLRRDRDDPAARAVAATACVTALFGLAMLLKMILNARVSNYGYFLAMPATTLSLAALVGRLPASLSRRGLHPIVFRAGLAAALLVTLAWHLALVQHHLGQLTNQVGRGRDAFYAGGRGHIINLLLRDLPIHMRPGETLAVLPEGAILNFLTHTPNPSPYIIFMPSDLLMFGEEKVIESLARTPPDWIVLAHKDTAEYGYRFFGRDYALSLMAWIDANYQPAALIGARPFVHPDRFGLIVLKRRPPATTPRAPTTARPAPTLAPAQPASPPPPAPPPSPR